MPGDQPSPDFLGKEIIGIVVASEHNLVLQQYVFPMQNIVQVKLFIEDDFCYHEKKKQQIAYMPRRGAQDSLAVLNMLRFMGLDSKVDIVAIDGLCQKDVVRVLGESLIFLSFAQREGFGLPAAEAMASGCVVIGYTGNGGDEFFDSSYCHPIREGDLTGFVDKIVEVLRLHDEKTEDLSAMRKNASQRICARYFRDESKQTILKSFHHLIEPIC